MSIEAIKEALAAVEVPCPEGFEDGTPHDVRAFIAMGSRRNALRALEAACTPAAIRSLIERLEAAEKDAARAKQCALKYLDYLGNSDPENGLALDMRDPEMVGVELAAVDFGSGGFAEGVSDA